MPGERRRGGRPNRPPTRLRVTASELITPTLRRLWFHSEDLSAFEGSEFTDRYVKLLFPPPGHQRRHSCEVDSAVWMSG